MNKLKKKSDGFILLGSALAIFIILSLFSIYLIRIVIKEHSINNYNILDIKTRNLSISGLEHGVKLIEDGLISNFPIDKDFNNGSYALSINYNSTEVGSPLPYLHFGLLKSEASINDVLRNSRVFVSSYPNAFNLAFFGKNNNSNILNQNSGLIDGDVFFNGTINNSILSQESYAYSSNGNGAILNTNLSSDYPEVDFTYFTNYINSAPNTVENTTSRSNSNLFFDFESGNQGWTEHIVSYRETWGRRNTSGTNSYLGSYALGTINNGSTYGTEHSYVMSPTFNAIGGGTVSFNYWAYNEYSHYDREHLDISYDNGSSWTTLINYNSSIWSNSTSKKSHSVNIPMKLGNSTTRIRFRYNTIDGCCGSTFGFFIDNISLPSYQQEVIDYGIIENKEIDLSNDGSIISNGPYIQNGILTFSNRMTFINCTITSQGKIINKSTNSFLNCNISGNIEIISGDSLIITNSTLGNNINTKANAVILYSNTLLEVNNSNINGFIISRGNKTYIKNNSKINAAILSEAYNCIIEGSTTEINGSLVSKYSLFLDQATIKKSSLLPLHGNSYGIKSSVLPGTYYEY